MKPKKVGFVLCSNPENPIPSTRIAVLNMLPFLRAAGWDPCIVHAPDQPTETPDLDGVAERAIAQRCEVVVLQKVRGPSALRLVQALCAANVRTALAICDRVDVEMAAATDSTIVISDFLKSLYPAPLQHAIHVVHDGIEKPSACKTDWSSSGRPLTAVLVTSHQLDALPVIGAPAGWMRVRIVGAYRTGLGRLREIHWSWATKNAQERRRFAAFLMERRIRCERWGPATVYEELLGADVGIIPIATDPSAPAERLPPDWMRKSENRLTLKMSAGLPVIATPIPSYEAIIDHGRNGFLARTPGDWRACLEALRDAGLRQQMGLAARASVEQKYSMAQQGAKLVEALCRTIERPVKAAAQREAALEF